MASPTVRTLIAIACISVLFGIVCIICGVSGPSLICSQTCDVQCKGEPNHAAPAMNENNLLLCQACLYRKANITASGTCDVKYISHQETPLRNILNSTGALLLAIGLVMGICLIATTRRVINVESTNAILLVFSLVLFISGAAMIAITRSAGANICQQTCDEFRCRTEQYPDFAQASVNITSGRTHCLNCKLVPNSTTQCKGLDITADLAMVSSITYPFACMFVLFACILFIISLVNSSKPKKRKNEVQMSFEKAFGRSQQN
jgi:hypothetical protein